MATKSAIDGPGGTVVAGDHFRRDSHTRNTLLNSRINYQGNMG